MVKGGGYKTYSGSSSLLILSLGSSFPLDTCLCLAFSPPPVSNRSIIMIKGLCNILIFFTTVKQHFSAEKIYLI